MATTRDRFMAELQALLDKYGASMEATDHWQGYAECGRDIRITVEIPGIYSDGETVREYVEIDLGSSIFSADQAQKEE